MSRSASAAPRSPATVENRTKAAVCLPTSENSRARVNRVTSAEGSIGPAPLGVHPSLRDHFAIEMRQLLQKPDILEENRAPRPSGLGVEVVRGRGDAWGRSRSRTVSEVR